MSVAVPNSFCPYCQKTLKPQDRFPLIGFILLGGKCRFCKKPISWRYPAVELLTGFLFLFLFLKFGKSLVFLKSIIFLSLLVVASFIDISHRIIPDVISIPGIVLGLLFGVISKSPNIINVLFGTLIGAGILWIFRQAGLLIRKQEMMGWGDIKLAAMFGAFLGIKEGVLALFLGVCLGVIIWTILMLLKLKTRKEYIPFGAFLALGGLITVFYGNEIINWYLRLFRFP